MSLLEQLMNGGGGQPQYVAVAAPPPARVSMALQYVGLMRSTSCKHLAHGDEDDCARALVCTSQHEAGAYNAACEALRLYFNGEMGPDVFAAPRPGGGPEPGEPPPGLGAELLPPSSGGSPAAAVAETRGQGDQATRGQPAVPAGVD